MARMHIRRQRDILLTLQERRASLILPGAFSSYPAPDRMKVAIASATSRSWPSQMCPPSG